MKKTINKTFNEIIKNFNESKLFAALSALKKNLSASGCPPVPVVVVIPVIMPVNPSTLSIDVIFSVSNIGNSTNTCGGVNAEYPNPGLVIVVLVIAPLDMVAVAVAVVPTPTGDPIVIDAVPV